MIALVYPQSREDAVLLDFFLLKCFNPSFYSYILFFQVVKILFCLDIFLLKIISWLHLHTPLQISIFFNVQVKSLLNVPGALSHFPQSPTESAT